MTGCIRNLCAAALCAAALLAAPVAAAQQRGLERINELLVSLQREAGEAGGRLQALAGARDAALRARDHVAAARSQAQVAVGDGDPATRLQSAIAARRALESARLAEAPPDKDLSDELRREARRADGALESVEATIRQNRSADRQRAAAGTADRHLATVDYVLARVLEARQAWLANIIDGYRRFVSEAGRSLSALDQAARNAAR